MRIGIDIRCLSEGRRTGVEEYTINLLDNLFQVDSRNEYILFFNSWKKSKVDFTVFTKYANVKIKNFSYPNKLLNFFFWYLGWPKIDKLLGGVDAVFMPNIVFGSVSKNTKLIVTIHDLSFERYPEHFSWKRRFWHIFINPKNLCRRADQIIAVSESTKNDLISLYRVNPNKINVIYNAVSERFTLINRNSSRLVEVKEKYNLPYKFILYLGTIEPRKNINAIVAAYNNFKKMSKDDKEGQIKKYKLIIAGESGWLNEKIFAKINNSPYKKDIQLINFVADQDKEYLYNLAALFIYPSFFEGFGFPPLEAMKCGVPVIVSNNSSLPEIAGGAAIMVNPDRPNEISQAMENILGNSELRERLIQKGLEKSNQFQWVDTARKTLEIIGK